MNGNFEIVEAELTEQVEKDLVRLSADWAAENSCYGYYPNGREDLEGNRIFLAKRDAETVGYLLLHRAEAQRSSSIMADGTAFYELEELYVSPALRSQGIGRALYQAAEAAAKAEGVEYLMLSTATKDYRKIFHFYIEEMGMDFWSARLFKKI